MTDAELEAKHAELLIRLAAINTSLEGAGAAEKGRLTVELMELTEQIVANVAERRRRLRERKC